MGYIGPAPASSFQTLAKQDFTTSATTNYTLSQSVSSANDIALFINNVRQEPTYAYGVSGTALTLTEATSSSDDMYCIYLGKAISTIGPSSGSVGIGNLSATGTKDSTTFLRGDNTFATPSISGAYESALLHVRQEESSGGGSGSISTSAWNTRTLNTVMTNEITSASLSSNQITLPSGTYYIYAYGLGYACNKHQTKLYNTTDASDVLLGNSGHAHLTYGQNTHSIVSGRFTISAQKVFELQSKSSSSRSTNGMGVHTGIGTEVYTDANIWKVA